MSAWLQRLVTMAIMLSLGLLGPTTVVAPAAHALVDDRNPSVSWRPANGIAYAQARVGDMIVLGGTFTAMRSPTGQTVTRNRLAAVSASTGDLLPWNPNPNGTDIRTVAASPDGTSVYVGGSFTSIGGAARTNVAALSATTGAATPFTANTNASVRQLRLIDGRLFMVGTFWKVNGVNRGNGAELDPTTGALRPWNPQVTAGLITVAGAGDGIYVGGYFSSIGGVPRDHVAKVDRTTGALLPWTSGSTCQDSTNPCDVWDILATSDALYLAQGGPGGRIVSLDPTTGVQRWWTGADGDFTSIVRDGTKLYAAGHFADAVAGVPRAGIVVLDARTGGVLPDLTTPIVGGSGVWQLLLDNGILRACGQFSTVGTTALGKYVSFPIVADPPDLSAPQAPGGFRAPSALADQVSLSWSPAVDDVATIQYRVRRDGAVIANPSGTSFKDRSVTAGSTYTYTVEALDAAGNVSAPSRAVTVTTESDQARLLQRGAPWTYLSLGTAPGSGWTAAGFAESSWATGTGEFGFGDGDEDSAISPKGVAHYFRTTFAVADPAALKSATLRLLVDDGAVVHLNGEELTRVNMPSGAVTNDTLAVTGITGTAEMTYQSIAVPPARLKAGVNQLAVEVHNSSPGSSDISFDAFVTAVPQETTQVPVVPTGLTTTTGSDRVTLQWNSVPGALTYTVRRDGTVVGTTQSPSFTDTGLSPATTYTYTVTAGNAAGTSAESDATQATTTSAAMVAQYIPPGASWRYLDGGATPGTDWTAATYDDLLWRIGAAQLGYGDGDETTVLNFGSSTTKKPITYYFRTSFEAGDSVSDVTALRLRTLVDDGAVVYLNGQEIWRFNLPTGSITSTTRALTAVAGADETRWRSVDLPASALRAGRNVVAVELHQDLPGSSDISLDVGLDPVR